MRKPHDVARAAKPAEPRFISAPDFLGKVNLSKPRRRKAETTLGSAGLAARATL